MSFKQLFITVLIATLLCWLSWILILNLVDPTASGFIGPLMFFATLFLSLLGTIFLLTSVVRKTLKKDEPEHKIVGASFRQSILYSLTIILALFLQSSHFLTWWNLLLLVIAVAALEYFFLSFKKSPPPPRPTPPTPGYIPPDF